MEKNYILIYESDFLHVWPVREPKIILVTLSYKRLDTHEITCFMLLFKFNTFAGVFLKNHKMLGLIVQIFTCNTVIQRINPDQKIGILTCESRIPAYHRINFF